MKMNLENIGDDINNIFLDLFANDLNKQFNDQLPYKVINIIEGSAFINRLDTLQSLMDNKIPLIPLRIINKINEISDDVKIVDDIGITIYTQLRSEYDQTLINVERVRRLLGLL